MKKVLSGAMIYGLIVTCIVLGTFTLSFSEQKIPSMPGSQTYVTLIVPTPPGGGFDTAARLFAPYLRKYLNKNVVVKNMPGAQWNTAINYVNKAKPDGYTIGILNLPGNLLNQVIGKAPFDLTKIQWIGRIIEDPEVGALSPKSKFRTLNDLKKAPVVKIAIGNVLTNVALVGAMSLKQFGVLKTVPVNHPGSSEAVLSALRGDVDFVVFPLSSLKQYIIDSKELTPVVFYYPKRLPELPNVPTAGELGYPELLDIGVLHRVIGTTPGTPAATVEILRRAFWQAANDPKFKAEMEKSSGFPVHPANGKDTEKLANRMAELVMKYEPLMNEVYGRIMTR